MERVLVIVDVQNDFCPGGSLAVEKGIEIIPVINGLSENRFFTSVMATQDWHPAEHVSFASRYGIDPFSAYKGDIVWPDHCVQGSSGAELHASLNQNPIKYILRKGMNRDLDSYSAFRENDRKTETGLHKLLDKDSEIFITGIATDVCVYNTAMDALEYFPHVTVIEDACAGVSFEGTCSAVDRMKQKGIKVITSEDLLLLSSD